MTLDLRKLQQSLSKYAAAPLYFLVGADEYMVDEALAAIKAKVVTEGMDDFNFNSFYGTDTKGVKILDHVETLPMMSEMRMVLVKRAEGLKEKDWDILTPILEEVVDTCSLVFVFNKIDKRKKFYKLAQKKGVIIDLKTPYDNQIPSWIEYIAGQHKVSLSGEATAMLFQLVGNHLIEVKNELIKLRSFKQKNKDSDEVVKVTKEDILQVVSKSKFENVFELTKALGQRDRGQALYFLAQLLDSGQNEIATLALVKRHIRILSHVKKALNSGLAHSQLGSTVGVPQFFVKEYSSQATKWTDQKINATMDALKDTDMALKSSPISSHIWLENFIIKSCE